VVERAVCFPTLPSYARRAESLPFARLNQHPLNSVGGGLRVPRQRMFGAEQYWPKPSGYEQGLTNPGHGIDSHRPTNPLQSMTTRAR